MQKKGERSMHKYASRNPQKSLDVPDSVEAINQSKFDDVSLTNITLGKNVKSSRNLYFTNSYGLKYIYVDENKSASIFSNYADRIYPVSQKN